MAMPIPSLGDDHLLNICIFISSLSTQKTSESAVNRKENSEFGGHAFYLYSINIYFKNQIVIPIPLLVKSIISRVIVAIDTSVVMAIAFESVSVSSPVFSA